MDVDVGGWLLELETEADVVYFVAMIQYHMVL